MAINTKDVNQYLILGSMIVIIVASWILLYVNHPQIDRYYDANVYVELSEAINRDGLQNFYNIVRTYGYPLFLAVVTRVSSVIFPGFSVLEAVCFVQFILHTCVGIMCLKLWEQLDDQFIQRTLISRLSLFSLIQLNPVLLSLTRELLTDSITVFLFILLFLLLFTCKPLNYWLIGSIIGLLIVVRPFHLAWSTALATVLFLLWITLQLHDRSLRTALRFSPQIYVVRGVQLLLPISILVGFQVYTIWQHEGAIGIIGEEGNAIAAEVTQASTYLYKYETFLTDFSEWAPGVPYVNSRLENYVNATVQANDGNFTPILLIRTILSRPVEFSAFYVVKAIGVFQNYTWEIYRANMENYPSFIFIFGLIPLTLYLYVSIYVVTHLKQFILTKYQSRFFLVWISTVLYFSLYLASAVLEGRYIAPILPLIMVMGWVLIHQQRDWKSVFLTALLAFVLYVMTYQTLLDNLRLTPWTG